MLKNLFEKGSPVRFIVIFLSLFALFYFFNIMFFGITSPGNHYIDFLAQHLNYIHWLRQFLLRSSAVVLGWLGYAAITNEYLILVAGHGKLQLVYSCLGLGLMSFFSAFVIAYPGNLKPKIFFIITGNLIIQLLNILRFVLLALLWDKNGGHILDHHTIFNICMYLIIAAALYFWVNRDRKKNMPSTL